MRKLAWAKSYPMSSFESRLAAGQAKVAAPAVVVAICYDADFANDAAAVLSDDTPLTVKNQIPSLIDTRLAPDMQDVGSKIAQFAVAMDMSLSVSAHSQLIEGSKRGFFFAFGSKELRDRAFAAYQAL